ncbi:MAG: hybrid sensor histidine kinase/response regulator [Acidobacteria bacterium]|nr:hybrid sensor histidine kinase/response regulator [Acidobacteriota bacterium]
MAIAAMSLPKDEMPAVTHVLMVEDNAADRNLVRISLSDMTHPYRLDCADHLADGLEKLKATQPDVILLDLNLPDSQGRETVQKVLAVAPHVPILVLTGINDDALARDAVRAGAQDYLVKGKVESQVLAHAMRNAIERHRVSVELRENRDKQVEFKDRFLSHVSHELRSPLACIHQYAEVMLEGLAGPLNIQEQQYLQNVLRSAKQLNSLINDLLDAARANVAKISIEPACVRPCEIVGQVAQMLAPQAKSRNILLNTEIEPYIPSMLGDRRRLLQVVTNLVENALKYTEAGGSIKISSCVYAEDPRFIQISVADTGRGIHPSNLSRVFDRLYQEPQTQKTQHGLGLGLAICKELVESHGGKIWVESKFGKGSVFFFTAPMFSLPEVISPVLLEQGRVRPATLIAVEIARRAKTVTADAWECARRRCREVVERCILPDKDVLLPSMQPLERREMIFVLACTDAKGAGILESRICGQLAATPEITSMCIYRTFPIALPMPQTEFPDVFAHLEWVSEEIERTVSHIANV